MWRDWRRPTPPPSRLPPPELPEYRFNAADYDAEIARAESDHSWAWPARSTARLIAAGLRDRPDLLTRWDARPGWIGTDFTDPDATVLSFTYRPGLAAGQRDKDGPWLQFTWSLPEDGTPPEDRAAAALRLATADPKTYAEVGGRQPRVRRGARLPVGPNEGAARAASSSKPTWPAAPRLPDRTQCRARSPAAGRRRRAAAGGRHDVGDVVDRRARRRGRPGGSRPVVRGAESGSGRLGSAVC